MGFGRFRKGAPIFLGVEMSRVTKETIAARDRTSSSTTTPTEPPKSRKDLIASLLSRIETQLNGAGTKVTLADFIRLIQLQRELEQEEQPAEVIVSWRDLPEKQNVET